MFKKFIEHFTDPLEYIRLKSFLILICCLAVLMLDRRY